MIRSTLAAALLFAGLGTVAHAETAQPQCAPRAKFVAGFTEARAIQVLVGIMDENTAVEVWVDSQGSQQWVELLTTSDGKSCVVAKGTGLGAALNFEAPAAPGVQG